LGVAETPENIVVRSLMC